jgi:hypothetical protein
MTVPASNTPYGIISDAMHDAGYLSKGQLPTGEDNIEYMRRLNDLINVKQTKGLKLFLNVDTSVTLSANVSTYTFGPAGSVVMVKPLRVIEGWYVDANKVSRPLTPLAWKDFILLGNKEGTGPITQYLVDKKAALLSVRFWLVPDAQAATGVAHLLLQIQATNPVNLTEAMAFPQEWRMALRWGLADDISTGQPETIMARCKAKADEYWTILEDFDVEDAPTRFTPDTQMMTQNMSRFR